MRSRVVSIFKMHGRVDFWLPKRSVLLLCEQRRKEDRRYDTGYIVIDSIYSFRTTAGFRFFSFIPYNSGIRFLLTNSWRYAFNLFSFLLSSSVYRDLMSVHLSGSCPKRLCSPLLGAISFPHAVSAALSFDIPRGDNRSSKTRLPSF